MNKKMASSEGAVGEGSNILISKTQKMKSTTTHQMKAHLEDTFGENYVYPEDSKVVNQGLAYFLKRAHNAASMRVACERKRISCVALLLATECACNLS
jgi:hypothetical protein